MNLNTLRDVYTDTLRDLYSAEQQIARALPKMMKASSTPELKKAFERHLDTTKKQMERLETVCREAGIKAGGKKCAAMEGLLSEGEEIIQAKGSDVSRDAALIVAAQKVEHYEIAGYGSARTFAEHLGFKQSAKLLNQTLAEESKTDERLTAIALRNVNRAAEAEPTGNGRGDGRAAGTRARAAAPLKKSAASGSRSAAPSRAVASKGRAAAASGTPGSRSKPAVAAARTQGAGAKSKAPARPARTAAKAPSRRVGGSTSDVTLNHDTIRQWAEERGGWPARVRGTGKKGDIGLLRIDFPGFSGADTLVAIEWDDFFKQFEAHNLAFLHQDRTADGHISRFCKLIAREPSDR